jgi:uncharacterized membrane protein YgaE (UPF0421/DUF939 family)
MWTTAMARVKGAFTRALAASVAAGLAYWLAKILFGHEQPIFAAIAAIICLAPGILHHFRQSTNLLSGVTIGVVVGEVIFLIPFDLGEIRFAIAILLAMLAAAMLGKAPIVPILAGASALLVVAIGPHYAGISRFLDVVLGAVIGLVFALLFFHPRIKYRS